MKRIAQFACYLFLAASVAVDWQARSGVAAPQAKLFPLSDVKLLDGPFKHAQELNRQYLLKLEPDRLLAPFRKEAGLEPKAAFYKSWEDKGLAGQTAGHYLTALAQMSVDTGDAEIKRRLDYMVAELAECQKAGGDGWVGGVPNGRALWKEIAAGDIRPQPFDLNRRWVPWYNMHKTFAGLRDAYAIGGSAQAKDVLVALADWCDKLLANLSDEQVQRMLRAEQGGMNEVLADVSAITGDRKYLALAKRFSHRAILDPLLARQNQLAGLHANTQIPKVIGLARIGELTGDENAYAAAQFFWDLVVDKNTVAIGGNSSSEHFLSPENSLAIIESHEGVETCNTYNMMRLSEKLFANAPSARLADFYERGLFNHILGAQNPEHGGLVYFTPMRPRHYRVYSQPETCTWCCVGTGIENYGKLTRFIYAAGDDELYVNLFIPSELNWAERGVKVRQETEFPDVPKTRLTLSLAAPKRFKLLVRRPGWVADGQFAVVVNGQRQADTQTGAAYVTIDREWKDGDRVELEIPMRLKMERLAAGSDYAAIEYGPIVLAARTPEGDLKGQLSGDGRFDHIASGPKLPLEEAPVLVGKSDDEIVAGVKPMAGKPLTFSAKEEIRPETFRDLELIPFYRLHDSRYVLYWKTVKE